MRLRALLLDTAHTGLSPWAEVMMYAADRAEHVASVISPALARGTIVVTDRYVDSTLAYQGGGRQLPFNDIRRVNELATGGLVPDLTFLLDLPPVAGLGRRASSADRLEAEPEEFHDRVRDALPGPGQGRPRPVRRARRHHGALADQPGDPGRGAGPAARPGARAGRGDHRLHPGDHANDAVGRVRPAGRSGSRRRAAAVGGGRHAAA